MKKILVSLIAVVMLAITATAHVNAFDYTDNDDVAGTTTKLEKYLVFDKDAQTPGVTFTYTMSGLTSQIDATATTLAVYPGITPDLVKVNGTANSGTTPFTAGEAKTNGALVGVATADQAYVKKDINLDFSGVTFTEPGVYRYFIQESQTAGVTTDLDTKAATANKTWRTVDVYVEDTDAANGGANGAHDLVITGYVAYEGKLETGGPASTTTATPSGSSKTGDLANATTANGNEVSGSTKNNKYVNEYDSCDLDFAKEVTGNQGSRDKYFAFTVKLTGDTDKLPSDTDVFVVDMTNATQGDISSALNAATTVSGNNPSASGTDPITVTGADLKAGKTFYLQHGQNIKIQGLPAGATYTVTEAEEDYTKTASVVTNYKNATTGVLKEKDALSDANGTDAVARDNLVSTSFSNAKNGVIPTGVMVSVAGGVGLIGIALFALLALNRKKEIEE